MTAWEQLRDFILRRNQERQVDPCATWKEQADLWKKSSVLWRKRYEDAQHQALAPPPIIIGSITANEIADLIRAIWPNANIAPYDSNYSMTTIESIQEFIRQTKVAKLPAIPDEHDCDDYTFGILGELSNTDGWWSLPIGLIDGTYKGGHVWLIAIAYGKDNPTATVYCLESTPPNAGDIIPIEIIKKELIGRILIP